MRPAITLAEPASSTRCARRSLWPSQPRRRGAPGDLFGRASLVDAVRPAISLAEPGAISLAEPAAIPLAEPGSILRPVHHSQQAHRTCWQAPGAAPGPGRLKNRSRNRLRDRPSGARNGSRIRPKIRSTIRSPDRAHCRAVCRAECRADSSSRRSGMSRPSALAHPFACSAGSTPAFPAHALTTMR